MKKGRLLFLATSLAVVLTGGLMFREECLVKPSAESIGGARIAVVSKSVKGEFWELIEQGMKAAIDEVNEAEGRKGSDKISMTFEGSDSEMDLETQINTLDAVIAENPAVLCLCAADMDSCQAQLEAAAENGIPVVAFDSNLTDTSRVRCYCGTDNKAVGQMAAEKLAEALGGSGKVAVFSVQEKTSSLKDRLEAFQSIMAEYPEIEITDMIYQDQVEDIQAAMTEIIENTPDLAGVYCSNADIADLYLDIEKPEGFSALMVGTDATSTQQEAIIAGTEYGCVSQNPYEIGYETMKAAIALNRESEGREEEQEDVLLEGRWIDADTILAPENEAYLY